MIGFRRELLVRFCAKSRRLDGMEFPPYFEANPLEECPEMFTVTIPFPACLP
jgi:hypothetical protein